MSRPSRQSSGRLYTVGELTEGREAKRRRRRFLITAVVGASLAALAALVILLGSETGGATRSGATTVSTGAATKPTGETNASTPQAEKSPKGKVTIAATGDIAMGREGFLPPDGGATLFAQVDRYLAGDVVLGNLETALASGGPSKCGAGSANCFAFRSPPSYARWLKRAGFTVLNLANNHSYDYGEQGERETIRALERFGLRHTGRPNEIAHQRVGNVRIAILGFAPYAWAEDLLDIRRAKRLVRRADVGADLVIVTMHAGGEGPEYLHVRPGPEIYLGEPRGNTVAFSHAVVDAGADLVVGHGPHVLRGMEWYRRRLIAYSLGNFSGYHNFSSLGPLAVSAILRVTLRGDGAWRGGELVATRLVGTGTPVPDPAEEAHGLVRRLSKEDFARTAMRVARTGSLLPPRGGG